MERCVLFAGKEYPDGSEFAIAATKYNRAAVITVATMPEDREDDCISENIYPAKWSRNSPLSARSVILQAENACGAFQEAVIIFDTNWYSGDFEELTPSVCSKAIDTMITSYTHLVGEIVARFKKKGSGTIIFVLKKATGDEANGGFSKPVGVLPGMAEGAFRGLAESMATTFGQDESMKIVLAKADYGTTDNQFASWLFEVLDAPNSILGKYDAKKGPQWFKMGAKTGKSSFFNPFQKK